MRKVRHSSERYFGGIEGINNADKPDSRDSKRIYKSVIFPQIMSKSEEYQHYRNGIYGIEYRYGYGKYGVQSEIAYKERKGCDNKHPFLIRNLCEER